MDQEIYNQMQDDIELARNMSDISNAATIRSLVNNLISYLDIITQNIAEYEYKASQLKGKKRTLEEYIRNGKDMAKELSISESISRKS